MDVIGIADETLEFALAAARDMHPREFMAYLRAEDAADVGVDRDGRVITEVVVMPGTTSTPESAQVPEYSMPIRGRGAGSVHSHPNGVLQPSDADLQTFEGGGVHIILGHPYNTDSWRAFDADGNVVELSVVAANLDESTEEW